MLLNDAVINYIINCQATRTDNVLSWDIGLCDHDF